MSFSEIEWEDLCVSPAHRKYWDELGISPEQFAIFREASQDHFATGSKKESDRIWKLLKAGHTLKSLIALASEDNQRISYSCRLGCLLELTDKKLPATPNALNKIRKYLQHLPNCFDYVTAIKWMQLLSIEELISLGDRYFKDGNSEREFEAFVSALKQLRKSTDLPRADQIRLLGELAAQFELWAIFNAIESERLIDFASKEIEQFRFISGNYGDWIGLGLSIDEMFEIVELYYEDLVVTKKLVTSFYKDGANNLLFVDFKNLLKDGLTAAELLKNIRNGVTASDVLQLKSAGLPITGKNLADWSSIEGEVILFCIDNGISRDDFGARRFDFEIPPADVVIPWWNYCKKQGWIHKYTKTQLFQSTTLLEGTSEPLAGTPNEELVVELLSLSDYILWSKDSKMRGKFKEINEWRTRGFRPMKRTSQPNFEGLDGHNKSDAHAWRYFKFSPEDASVWTSLRLAGGESRELSAKGAAQWRNAGVKPEEIQTWLVYGFKKPAEVAAWIASGATPQIAANRKKAGVAPVPLR